MNPRVKEAILWGVVGLFTFLVLLQGYEIVQGVRVDLAVKIGATAVVAVATTAVTYLTSGRVEDVAVSTSDAETVDADAESEDARE